MSAILALSVRVIASGGRSLYVIAQWGRMPEPTVLEELGFTRDRTPAVSTLHKVKSWRAVKGKLTCQVPYTITGLGTQTPAARLLSLVRGNWRIENRLHHVRDVTMGEDSSKAHTDSAP